MSTLAPVRLERAAGAVTLVTPGFRAAPGGLEAHVSALVKELAAQGFRVIVLTARRGLSRTSVERHDDCWVVTYPAWSTASMSVSPRLLWAAIRSRRNDRLLHVHGYHSTTALALLGRRAPTVFTPHYHGKHGHSRLANLLHVPYYQLHRWLITRCDAVICVSEAERRTLVADFPSIGDRVTVIPNGIDASAIRGANPLCAQPATVLSVGRLEPYKRVDAVVRAFVDVPAPAQLVVIGDGSQRAELTALVGDLGLSHRVHLIGSVSDAVLHRWLRTAKVFVSMSEREAFGMAPVEAACAGARIILSDIPAHREIADDYLRRCVTVMTDPSPAAIASTIQQQLQAPWSDGCATPDWHDVAIRTARVYRTSGVELPAPGGINGHQVDKKSPRHEGLQA